MLFRSASSDDFKSMLNQATRKLMNRGPGERAWWGTVQKLQICTYENCLTWPRWVGTPIAINTFGRSVPVKDSWYSFMPFSRGDWNCGGFSWSGGCCRGNLAMENTGTSPVFKNVPCGKDYYIRAYPQTRQDIGKVITIFGTDYNGQEIRTKRADGTFQDGVEITIAVPYASTPFKIRHISRVLKPVTANVVRLYQYDADNDLLLDCAVYYPKETSPNYRTSRIRGALRRGNCSSQGCDGLISVQAMVKLEFIPVEEDNDLVLIENIDALQLMMQSIRAQEGGDIQESQDFEAAAIRELNLRLEDKIPVDQIPIEINPFGSALPSRAGIGRLI